MRSLHIETLAIGDELLTGRTSDTNTTFVTDLLFRNGLRCVRTTLILDDLSTIQGTLTEISRRADAVICFGGLGPTSDDKTAEAVTALLNCSLVEHPQSKQKLILRYEKLGRPLTTPSLKQILYPEKTRPIANSVGAAPGFKMDLGKCRFYFLPGVPEEMKAMFTDFVLEDLKTRAGATSKIQYRTWKCYEVPESELQRILDPLEARLPEGLWVGYRTNPPENDVTLYSQQDSSNSSFETFALEVEKLLSGFTFAKGDASIEEIILNQLERHKASVCFVESCTGGLCVQRMTKIPGSSKHVWGGYTVYQVPAKKAMLDVFVKDEFAAVSKECSKQLAENALKVSGCDVVATITGFMGPTGGTAEDPIGTIYLCVLGKKGVLERRIKMPPRNREGLQWAASSHLLHLVRAYSSSEPLLRPQA